MYVGKYKLYSMLSYTEAQMMRSTLNDWKRECYFKCDALDSYFLKIVHLDAVPGPVWWVNRCWNHSKRVEEIDG